jgi:hypothetical protein
VSSYQLLALADTPIRNGARIIMTYERRIKRWIVVRLLPNFQHVDIERFYKFSDAEGYAQTLQRLNPNAVYTVMFDGGTGEIE